MKQLFTAKLSANIKIYHTWRIKQYLLVSLVSHQYNQIDHLQVATIFARCRFNLKTNWPAIQESSMLLSVDRLYSRTMMHRTQTRSTCTGTFQQCLWFSLSDEREVAGIAHCPAVAVGKCSRRSVERGDQANVYWWPCRPQVVLLHSLWTVEPAGEFGKGHCAKDAQILYTSDLSEHSSDLKSMEQNWSSSFGTISEHQQKENWDDLHNFPAKRPRHECPRWAKIHHFVQSALVWPVVLGLFERFLSPRTMTWSSS